MLIRGQCAATLSSRSVKAWLRIDLKRVYLISKVIIAFYGRNGRNAMIRVGSSTSNDGNDNLLCGTVNSYEGDGLASIQRRVQCKERLWGRYVDVQRPTSGNLEICEAEIYNGQCRGVIQIKPQYCTSSNVCCRNACRYTVQPVQRKHSVWQRRPRPLRSTNVWSQSRHNWIQQCVEA